jgi:hypothetical protein
MSPGPNHCFQGGSFLILFEKEFKDGNRGDIAGQVY